MVIGQTAGVRLLMRFDYLPKFIGLLIPQILLMIAFPLFMGYTEEETAWTVSNILVVLIGIVMGTMTCFLGAIAGVLGPSFVGPLMQGFQLSFVLVALVRLICLLVFNSQDTQAYLDSTILYFSLNVAILILMLILVPVFFGHDVIKRALFSKVRANLNSVGSEKDVHTVKPCETFEKISFEAYIIFLTFMTTFLIYPSIVFQKQQDIISNRSDWSIFILNVVVSIADLLGRNLASRKPHYQRTFLGTGCFLRLTLVCTTLLIGLSSSPFWNNIFVVLINAGAIGLTNGFFATAACNSIPGRLEEHEKEFGGFVMSVVLNTGIGFGQLVSLISFQRLF
ncbi:hypothetical protein FGO68_gene14863 [Halteria grandinella]|uniref:Equilibrative nucleoside transporter n=1 Tax=Halteria grandinella TaxID=5974 RepID=A0A8J8NCT8_HALGN|nr:hypothetical protein FGO68_gene14863 [Halteria grandinella]